jgi:hypothetical protein
MDVRDELEEIRQSLACLRCSEFLRIPAKLDLVVRNTERRRRKVAGK